MKYTIAVVLLTCVVAASAQEENLRPRPFTCYVGRVEGETIDNSDFEMKNCTSRKMSCQTKIEWNHGKMIVEKSCHERKACAFQQPLINEFQCYSGIALRNMVRNCLYCCRGNLCNDLTSIPRAP